MPSYWDQTHTIFLLFLFLYDFCSKIVKKSISQPAFGVVSTQTLVQKYNNYHKQTFFKLQLNQVVAILLFQCCQPKAFIDPKFNTIFSIYKSFLTQLQTQSIASDNRSGTTHFAHSWMLTTLQFFDRPVLLPKSKLLVKLMGYFDK